jgi:hypothetical protein
LGLEAGAHDRQLPGDPVAPLCEQSLNFATVPLAVSRNGEDRPFASPAAIEKLPFDPRHA